MEPPSLPPPRSACAWRLLSFVLARWVPWPRTACLLDDNIPSTTGASIAAPSLVAHQSPLYSTTTSSCTAPCVSPRSSLSLGLSCSHARVSASSYAAARVVSPVMPSAALAAGGLAAPRRGGPCPLSLLTSLPLLLLLFLLASQANVAAAMRPARIAQLRQEAVDMFYHGFDNYMSVAFPEDEVRL